MAKNNNIFKGILILASFIVVVFLSSWFIMSISPHNKDEQYNDLRNSLKEKEKEIADLEKQNFQLSLKQKELEVKFDAINKSLIKDFDKIIIDTSEITLFANLKSQVEFNRNMVESHLLDIKNLKYSLEDFSKNYPEGQLYADKIINLENKVDMQLNSINDRDDDFRNSVDSRLELWSKSFDLYSVILSIIATALIGLIGVVFFYIRKIEN